MMAPIAGADDEYPAMAQGLDGTMHTASLQRIEKNKFEEIPLDDNVEAVLNVTGTDLQEAKALADRMGLDEVKRLLENVLKIHAQDPNFPQPVMDRIIEFLGNQDVFDHPDRYERLIYEMKLEAALIHNNSPYSEVRAVVDNHDDPNMPSSTIRVWVIGIFFSCALASVNQLFSIRLPPIMVASNVAQLLAYPIGVFSARFLPDWGITLWGVRHSLNPGPFSKKEHMLITIMATVASGQPYSNLIIWTQFLKQYFDQSYAGHFGYQILIALSTNLIGYGMAGMTRRFLVYPTYTVWPASLSTIALNSAFHAKDNPAVEGPFRKFYRISRYKFFLLAFGAMGVYFWIPNYLFEAWSRFSWITWIKPTSVMLTAVAGFNNGLGFNPWPTFDWNVVSGSGPDPLMVPFFSTFNRFIGQLASAFVILALWLSNTWNTAFLPINSNHVFDNTGKFYNVSRAIDKQGMFDAAAYQAYSPAYLSAANLTIYLFFFAVYPATLTYIFLNHRYEVKTGLKALIRGFWKSRNTETTEYTDVHNRLMAAYPEAPDWWYLALLLVAIGCGLGGIAGWDTYTTPAVVFYGLLLCAIFVIPIGIVAAITGIEVTLNVLAEFIGGSLNEGNALAMNFFKSYGYVTCSQTLGFANDLKLAHYAKIPPRHTFMAQVVATTVSTFICTAILNFQMKSIPGVCTAEAVNNMSCPGINTFFTASVLWGTLGPRKMFGSNGQYTELMAGWGIGVALAVIVWGTQRLFPRQKWMRQINPVLLLTGALTWAPWNLSWTFPTVWISWLSWIWCKNRFVGFWSKYNFILSAAFSTAMAIAGTIMFFAVQWRDDTYLDWWGNSVPYQGCEDLRHPCPLKKLQPGEFFGPGPGQFT